MKSVAISLLILTCFVSFIHAGPLIKYEVVNAINRNARSNDGSPAAYFFGKGSGSGSKRWVIVLHGGGKGCYDPNQYGTWPGTVSPHCYGTTRDLRLSMQVPAGILSSSAANNPDFYNANQVFIPQLSFDFFAGNATQTVAENVIRFRGRNIFTSIITDLKNKTTLPNRKQPGTEVLLVGWGGNGGVGAMIHLDWLAKQLPNAKVRGFNDAGWFIPELNEWKDERDRIEQALILWKGRLDETCQRANPIRKSTCFMSSVYPYLQTPLFVYQSQADWHFDSPNADKIVRDSLIPVSGAFSPKAYTGRISDRYEFTTVKARGYSLADLLGNWFFERPGPIKIIQK